MLGHGTETFLGPVKEIREVSAIWCPKNLDFQGPTPSHLPYGTLVMDLPASKALRTGPYKSYVHK